MKKLSKRILADGEVTGHAHRVAVDVYEDADGSRVFEGETDVTHEEHRIVPLTKKKWRSDRVQEYDHFAEEAKRVVD